MTEPPLVRIPEGALSFGYTPLLLGKFNPAPNNRGYACSSLIFFTASVKSGRISKRSPTIP